MKTMNIAGLLLTGLLVTTGAANAEKGRNSIILSNLQPNSFSEKIISPEVDTDGAGDDETVFGVFHEFIEAKLEGVDWENYQITSIPHVGVDDQFSFPLYTEYQVTLHPRQANLGGVGNTRTFAVLCGVAEGGLGECF